MSHHQLLFHIVFSTKGRRRLLIDKIRDDVFAYMAGVAKKLDGHALNIGGFYDHVHLLVRLRSTVAPADFVMRLKSSTSKHVNENRLSSVRFGWQDGYGAFTVSASMRQAVYEYISRQMEHHQKRSFEDEYLKMLENHGVEFKPAYVFD